MKAPCWDAAVSLQDAEAPTHRAAARPAQDAHPSHDLAAAPRAVARPHHGATRPHHLVPADRPAVASGRHVARDASVDQQGSQQDARAHHGPAGRLPAAAQTPRSAHQAKAACWDARARSLGVAWTHCVVARSPPGVRPPRGLAAARRAVARIHHAATRPRRLVPADRSVVARGRRVVRGASVGQRGLRRGVGVRRAPAVVLREGAQTPRLAGFARRLGGSVHRVTARRRNVAAEGQPARARVHRVVVLARPKGWARGLLGGRLGG